MYFRNKYIETLRGGDYTYADLFNVVNDCIVKEPALKDCVKILDYAQYCSYKDLSSLPAADEILTIEAKVCTGGNEGVYMDCYLLCKDNTQRFAIYKTLDEDIEAYMKMGSIAGAFTYLAEFYLYLHW